MDDTGGTAARIEELYRETGPRLLAWLQRRHGSPQEAEDLLQETFAAVLRHPERPLQSVSPRAYVFGIARNLSNDAWRRFQSDLELTSEPPATETADADPRLDVMRESIAKLTLALREVLELRLQAELSYEEIAAVVGVPIGTVRSRLHHAVKQLRNTLNPSRAHEREAYES